MFRDENKHEDLKEERKLFSAWVCSGFLYLKIAFLATELLMHTVDHSSQFFVDCLCEIFIKLYVTIYEA